jgi:hypothetical protein
VKNIIVWIFNSTKFVIILAKKALCDTLSKAVYISVSFMYTLSVGRKDLFI